MEQSYADKSYEYIREKLTCGELPPGKKLVNRVLADEIGVSVIPVREAIHRLASEGLIEHVPGAGAYVRKASRQDLDNLYVLRDALESCAAAEAARLITDEQLEELEELLIRVKKDVQEIKKQPKGYSTKQQMDRWLDDERQFHELLIEASRNPLLAKVVNEHRAISNIFDAQRHNPRLLTAEVAEETYKFKTKFLQVLRNRDAELAQKLMSDQIQRGRKMVIEYFKNNKKNRS
tara:strand:- start:168 stop:869 length:702 start_codon:yes stop_codon:yes gene_type:complete